MSVHSASRIARSAPHRKTPSMLPATVWRAAMRGLAGRLLAGHAGSVMADGEDRPDPLLQHLFRRLEVVELHNHSRGHAGADEEGVSQFVVAGGPIEDDQPLGDDIGEAGRAALGKRMGWMGHQGQLIVVERDY